MESETAQRAGQILDALAGLSDEQIEQAAAHGPPEVASLLRSLVAARHADDPQAAVARAMDEAPAVADLNKRLGGLVAQLGAVPSVDASGLAGVFDEESRASLQDAARRIQAQAPDPALAAILEQGLALLEPEGPLGQAAKGAAELEGTMARLRAALAALAADPAGLDPSALEAVRSDLVAERDRLRTAAQDVGAVGDLLARLEALATGAGRSDAAVDLAMARAELLDRMDPEGAEGEAALWHALDLAEAAGRLEPARRMGHRLMVRAMRSGDLVPVYTVADRLAALAHRANDVPAEVVSLGRSALALAQLPASADEARQRLDRMKDAARYAVDPAVQAQALLIEGQVLEKLGDDAGARRAFRRLMRRAADDNRFPYELGWAALHLGRLERRAGQHARARDDLALAAAIGARVPDWLLYGMACRERFALARDLGDEGLARAVLHSLDTEGRAIGGAEAAALRDELDGRRAP